MCQTYTIIPAGLDNLPSAFIMNWIFLALQLVTVLLVVNWATTALELLKGGLLLHEEQQLSLKVPQILTQKSNRT